MQGTIVKIAVEDGQEVAQGDLVLVLEAMKMEQPITAHKAGTVSGLTAAVGETVTSGAVAAQDHQRVTAAPSPARARAALTLRGLGSGSPRCGRLGRRS